MRENLKPALLELYLTTGKVPSPTLPPADADLTLASYLRACQFELGNVILKRVPLPTALWTSMVPP